MKRAMYVIVPLTLVLASCGLKTDVIVAGSGDELGEVPEQVNGVTDLPGADDVTSGTDGAGPTQPGSNTNARTDTKTDGARDAVSSLFSNETEGVTKDTIRLCTHVPITGAAPIPHHRNRFGQFFFDYVNAELGGVYGRKVIFRAENDNYNPAGARNAVEQCAKQGAFLYFGAAGTDQIVSVAKWAERKKVPYMHGPTSDRDLGGLNYNVFAGPTYEQQHKLLARYLVKRFGKTEKYQTIKVDSPYFDAGANAFREEMKRLGVSMPPDIKVQKDESQFQSVYFELQQNGIGVVNNFTTPNVWIKMLNQKPATYDPTWTAVSPVAGFNVVAQALSGSGKAVVFHHFNPACECATYKDEEISQKKHLAWYNDIQQFLRIFKKYSPEQDPPPDDFDYSSYLAAKGVYRLLLAAGENPTRTKMWQLFHSYKEDPKVTFPGCSADFTRNKLRMGAWRVNIFELQSSGAGTWKQIHSCVDESHPAVNV